jgi:pimeloyl-ACP methyl ester carboxylesterase
MTITRRPFELANGAGEAIHGDLWAGDDPASRSAIVVCHGFKGFKDWGFFPYVAETLAASTGHPVITFNFSGNGIGPDMLNFTELGRFERNTFSKELGDLRAVLDTAASGGLLDLAPRRGFGLLGHSRGGISSVITAAEDRRIRCVVTWNAVAYLDRWSTEQKAEWRRRGRIEILNTRTGQLMPLGLGLLEDYERNAERLDLERAASRLRVPYLVIHGSADESVAVSEGERFDGAGHTFGAVHPFQGTTEYLTRAVELTAAWFRQNLE